MSSNLLVFKSEFVCFMIPPKHDDVFGMSGNTSPCLDSCDCDKEQRKALQESLDSKDPTWKRSFEEGKECCANETIQRVRVILDELQP
ncbi:hypothetical protein CBL_11151 [Carabus blaptoides fortunei]